MARFNLNRPHNTSGILAEYRKLQLQIRTRLIKAERERSSVEWQQIQLWFSELAIQELNKRYSYRQDNGTD